MEALQQARKLYIKCHQNKVSLTNEDLNLLESNIQRFITISIKEIASSNLFENLLLLQVLKAALKIAANENSDVMPLARAFEGLEKYFLLLVEQPWKPEFKKLKMYGGFYKTKIKAFLPDPESIFELAGYSEERESHIMVHKGPFQKEVLLLLSFDCKVAAVECKTIAEHYNKIKGLGMKLSDAVSNILHDVWTRGDKHKESPTFVGHGQKIVGNTEVDPMAPALPKREPIINGHDIQTAPVQVYIKQNNAKQALKVEPVDINLADGDGILHISPVPIASSSSQTRPSAISKSFQYIDEPAEEILPEFPQGTRDDHMRESLKCLEEGPQSNPNKSVDIVLREPASSPHVEDWKWFRKMQESGDIPASSGTMASLLQSKSRSVATYPPGFRPKISGAAVQEFLPDEGIEKDLSTSYRYPQSSRFSHLNQQQAVLPNKQSMSFQNSFYDQGYRTGPPSDTIYHPPSITGSKMGSQPIYHPPVMSTDGALSPPIVKQVSGPPPIPSRALKPNLPVSSPKSQDTVDGPGQVFFPSSAPGPVSERLVSPNTGSRSHSDVIATRPLLTTSSLVNGSSMSNTEPIMRRDRLTSGGKSSSLKYGDERSEAARQVAQSRAARSMDMSQMSWHCKSCTTVNSVSNTVCSVCTHSRYGPDNSHPQCGQTKKACPACTYENESSRTHCTICSAKLEDQYSYV